MGLARMGGRGGIEGGGGRERERVERAEGETGQEDRLACIGGAVLILIRLGIYDEEERV